MIRCGRCGADSSWIVGRVPVKARDEEVRDLRDENAKLRAVYELVANALEQIKQAHEDGLPGKAASFDDEMLRVLADYAPSGEKFSALAKKIRGDVWNNSLLTAAEKENSDLRAYKERTEAALLDLSCYYGGAAIHPAIPEGVRLAASHVCSAMEQRGLWREPKEKSDG